MSKYSWDDHELDRRLDIQAEQEPRSRTAAPIFAAPTTKATDFRWHAGEEYLAHLQRVRRELGAEREAATNPTDIAYLDGAIARTDRRITTEETHLAILALGAKP